MNELNTTRPAVASADALGRRRQAAGAVAFDPALGRKIALAYDELYVSLFDCPGARRAWDAMAADEVDLFTRATQRFHIQPWPGDGQPYADSAAMIADVLLRRHLWVFAGGDPHPVRTGMETYRGRAVHDIYAHAIPGNSFSPAGELAAFRVSMPLYSTQALPALATDNLGPTAWYYFHPSNEGKPHSERRWPVQKAGLLPRELWERLLP